MCGNERREVKSKIWNETKQSKRESMMCKAYTPKDGSGLRDQTSRPGRSAWRLLMALPILASCMQPSASTAENALVVNRLGASASMIADVQHYCPPRRAVEGIAGYSFKSETYFDDNFGSATNYRITAHLYTASRTQDDNVAIFISNLAPRSIPDCSAIIVLNSGDQKARIRSSFRDGDYKKHLPQMVSDEVARLSAKCEKLGSRARSHFLLGFFALTEDGRVVQDSDAFFCESAVMTSISSIDVTLKGSTIRIASVYNKIFLFEVSK
jgi:hypothetical protein